MKKKQGFTLMEMLIVVAIIAILVAIAIPTFSGALKKAREATCLANRRSLLAQLSVQMMLTDAESLEQAAQTDEGAAWVADCYCPSKGRISVSGNTITCSYHTDQELSASEQERQTLNGMISAASGSIKWQEAVNALSGKDTNYTFEKVSQVLLNAYAAAGGKVPDGVTLTWKPVISADGKSTYMIATANDRDASAISNAASGGSSGFNCNAYIIYDGTTYYTPLSAYSKKPNPTYARDNGTDLEAIREKYGLGVLTTQ